MLVMALLRTIGIALPIIWMWVGALLCAIGIFVGLATFFQSLWKAIAAYALIALLIIAAVVDGNQRHARWAEIWCGWFFDSSPRSQSRTLFEDSGSAATSISSTGHSQTMSDRGKETNIPVDPRYLETDNASSSNASDIYDMTTRYMQNYATAMAEAVSTGDGSIVRPFFNPGGPLLREQMKLIDSLYQKGMSEQLLGIEVTRVEPEGNDIIVFVTERHRLTYADGRTKNVENRFRYRLRGDSRNTLALWSIGKQ
mgnify:CR=1 FL=1